MYRETKELIETQVEHPCLTDWRNRIDAAQKRGSFTDEDRNFASQWSMCAVGEARRRYGVPYRDSDPDNGPIDGWLKLLGYQFADHLGNDRFADCRETIDAIERRLTVLHPR